MSISHAPFAGSPVYVRYHHDIEHEIAALVAAIEQVPALAGHYPPRWLAVQLLEGDEAVLSQVRSSEGGDNVQHVLENSTARLHQTYGEEIDLALTDQRYRFIHDLVRHVVHRPESSATTVADRVDKVVTHQLLGIPILLVMMWVVFKITTDVSSPYLDWIDATINGPITGWVLAAIQAIGLDGTWMQSLLVNGIIAGVGGVLVFVPVLMSLYLVLGILEDSGYMARAAFVMHRLMHTLGLHGKSFLPLIVGFGCNVPAIYATRTLENEKDRILTGLLVPFMSCSARLPVYILMAAIFFPEHGGLVIFSLYLLGIIAAIVIGIILNHTLFKGREQMPFIMELPPYHMPSPKNIWLYIWGNTVSFLRKAGTVILVISIVIWFLKAVPVTDQGSFADTELDQSAFAMVARTFSPVFAPLGFGSWEAGGALLGGFLAKEVIVSTLAQVHHIEEVQEQAEPVSLGAGLRDMATGFLHATTDTLKSLPLILGIDLFGKAEAGEPAGMASTLRQSFNASSQGHGMLAALAFMVFVLLYTPCMPTIVAERHEFGSRWMWTTIIGQFVVAWLVALLVFQGGRLLIGG